jgi:hypothetical protein
MEPAEDRVRGSISRKASRLMSYKCRPRLLEFPNIASKLLAFVAAFTPFLPRRSAAERTAAASSRPAGLVSPYA